MAERSEQLIRKAQATHCLTRQDIAELLGDADCEERLAQAADAVRQEFVGCAVSSSFRISAGRIAAIAGCAAITGGLNAIG